MEEVQPQVVINAAAYTAVDTRITPGVGRIQTLLI